MDQYFPGVQDLASKHFNLQPCITVAPVSDILEMRSQLMCVQVSGNAFEAHEQVVDLALRHATFVCEALGNLGFVGA